MKESLELLKNWLDQKQKAEPFIVPADAKSHHIRVACTEGHLQPELLRGLYILEHAMLEKGLNPDGFAIEKSTVYIPAYRGVPAYVSEYRVTFHTHSYTVRRQSDLEFLAYFSTLCLCDDKEEDDSPGVIVGLEDIVDSFYQKIVRWLKA